MLTVGKQTYARGVPASPARAKELLDNFASRSGSHQA